MMYVPIVPSTANATNNKSTNNDENTFFLEKSRNHSCFPMGVEFFGLQNWHCAHAPLAVSKMSVF
jgi:hypothetical protein